MPTRLRVVTYNVQFLPDPVSFKNERPVPDYRARRIAEEMSGFDIVALQETFHPLYRKQIIEGIEAKWGGMPCHMESPLPDGFHTSGGCLLLSRLPMVASSTMVYQNFSRPADFGLRADGYAAKGVIHARLARSLETPDDFIDVFVTHMEARDDGLRPLQFDELAEFVKRTIAADRPFLLLGDLNTRGTSDYQRDPDSQYTLLMSKLRNVRPQGGILDLWPVLRGDAHGGTNKQESIEIGQRIDYVIVGNPPQAYRRLKPISVDVNPYRDDKVFALSDHNAVIAELEWPLP